MKLWSFSTTVRNPERLQSFLKILKTLEGEQFNTEIQIKYQILLIKNRLYRPSHIPEKYKELFDNPEKDIPYSSASEVFQSSNYIDPAMRGRQSVNPLNKLGFCIARESSGKILITDLGNQFLDDKNDFSDIFFKSLLKLQFPNPMNKDFTKKDGFNVSPLITTMHLINKVNQSFQGEAKGLTQEEFALFIPSLTNYSLIDLYVQKILEYRKSNTKKSFAYDFAKSFYAIENPTEKQIKNFYEYGDNIMRYFRFTKFFKVTRSSFSSDWRIDLEPTRKVEIAYLLKAYDGSATDFASESDFFKYFLNTSLPALPWKITVVYHEIAENLLKILNDFIKEHNLLLSEKENKIMNVNFKKLNVKELKTFLSQLRKLKVDILKRHDKSKLIHNADKLEEIILILKDFKLIKKFEPEQFEKLFFDLLRILNDEIEIVANYPTDDSGEPISHALPNLPDIECYYASFNAIFEVTLITNSYQWIKETQPVMRHFRDFENRSNQTFNYCLFIAPKIHIDTAYHFWVSVKHGYNGEKQKIIPFDTVQFSNFLESILFLLKKGILVNQYDIIDFYNLFFNKIESIEGHSQWLDTIPEVIRNWQKQILLKKV